MIEVNLLPGGKKRAARARRRSFALPRLHLPTQDRWVIAATLAWLTAAAWMAWLALSLGPRSDEAQVALERERQDSATNAVLIQRVTALLARRDSIVQRVSIIQDIDQGRYVWPHILDEVARAVPDYTWLTQLQQLSGGPEPRMRVVGEAGNLLAVTVFMDQLEASPFLRGVRIIGSTLRESQSQLVYAFELEFSYEQPPLDLLETVPLLGSVPGRSPADMDR